MDYSKPQYLQNFERVNYFAEFENNDNDFIKLVYYIEKPFFKSALGTNKKLRNYTAYNGEAIFNAYDKIDFDRYTLKEEIKADADIPNVYIVEEVYGYAPDFTFIDYENQIVQRCGVSDPSGYKKIAMGKTCSYDASDGTMKLDLTSADYANQFSVGDIVFVDRPATSSFNSMTSEETPVTEIDGKYVCVKNFTYILNYNGSTYTGRGAADALNELVTTYIIRNVSTRLPQNRNVLIKLKISFVESVPESISQKFTPVDGAGSEVDIINTATIPNTELWKKIVAGTATAEEISGLNGITEDGYMLIEDVSYEKFHGIYKKTLKYTKCI